MGPLPAGIGAEGEAAWWAYKCVSCNATLGGEDGNAIRLVWERWLQFIGPANNPPLKRQRIGTSERDINLDGAVTIGMLPDLLQDSVNQGADVRGIFQTAQRYLEVMQRSEQ